MNNPSQHSLTLQSTPSLLSNTNIICDVSMGIPRPLVPKPLLRIVLTALHSLSHPGIRATQCLIVSRFVWPKINADVRQWSHQCLQCQRLKIQRHTVTPLSSFTTPKRRFQNIHMDLVDPLPPSEGYTYLLTIIDRLTRWPEVIPLAVSTAETVAHAFLSSWVSRFDAPATIRVDNLSLISDLI